MQATHVELTASVLFALAIVHTFSVKRFQHLALKYPDGSIGENLFHLLGEVEVVFGLWAGTLVVAMIWILGSAPAIAYMDRLDFTEPVFVFVIMAVAATRPVIEVANLLISNLARLLPLPGAVGFVATALVVGPLLGSFITEPAAMTVTALILKERLFESPQVRRKIKYLALGTLFVNVSVGGVLTPFAAPPVLMVAKTWGWDFGFMMTHFGWKATLGVLGSTSLLVFLGWSDLASIPKAAPSRSPGARVPAWLMVLHLLFLGVVVMTSHHVSVFLGVFLFFLGVVKVTEEYQTEVKLREALLVGWFLGGLVVLGGLQKWWLQPLLGSLADVPLFLGCTGLTAITDNAALTYLGAQVEGLSESARYALVAGAVSGGGLTVIANAPNPAGYSILQGTFGKEGVSPIGLLLGALPATVIVMLVLWFLPHLSV